MYSSVAWQASLSTGFSKQEYWSGLQCPPPGDLPDPGIKPASLKSPALEDRLFAISATWEVPFHVFIHCLIRDTYTHTHTHTVQDKSFDAFDDF